MKQKISDLSSECLNNTPVDFDWTTSHQGRGWTSYSYEACEKCGAQVPCTEGGGDERHLTIEDGDCDGYVPLFEGPMMNYYYPLGANQSHEDAARLAGPVCLVHFQDDDVWALALSGGGMDFSWEIAESYINLGYLPPIRFADLPAMAGRGASLRDQRILKACRASIVVGIKHLRSRLRRLEETKAFAAKHA